MLRSLFPGGALSKNSALFTDRRYSMDAETKRYIDQQIAKLKKEILAVIKKGG
jgi:hypothetical protein